MAPSQAVASQRRPGTKVIFLQGSAGWKIPVPTHIQGQGRAGHDLEDCGDGWAVALEQHL